MVRTLGRNKRVFEISMKFSTIARSIIANRDFIVVTTLSKIQISLSVVERNSIPIDAQPITNRSTIKILLYTCPAENEDSKQLDFNRLQSMLGPFIDRSRPARKLVRQLDFGGESRPAEGVENERAKCIYYWIVVGTRNGDTYTSIKYHMYSYSIYVSESLNN